MSSYAFIRFASLAEASKVARLMNGMFIYGWSIISKVATSDWNNKRMGPSKGSRKEEGDHGIMIILHALDAVILEVEHNLV
ncbi:hypothetical protein Q3G72_009708 [Acer saccharum]|nr:hypothetical protein Q3G72_020128 [Acer saccharum]KAK1587119.1 hypothetical protein Q3G72_009708 [Acer saccharum]